MTFNWQDPDTRDRLLAAIIASFDGKINCSEVARLFGKGATYNTIENCLRKPKRLAQELKSEAGDAAAPSPARPKTPKAPRTPKTPRSATEGVKSGRVSKKTSPVKKNTKIKHNDSDQDGEDKIEVNNENNFELF